MIAQQIANAWRDSLMPIYCIRYLNKDRTAFECRMETAEDVTALHAIKCPFAVVRVSYWSRN